jgi:glutaconate CoA-transferase, subunit B
MFQREDLTMPIAAPACAMGEMLAVLLARDMADGEKAIVGTNSDIQVAACNLARQRQAPHLWWVSGPGGMTNPSDGIIRPAADAENIAIAEAVMDLPQMIDFIDWQVHFFDFAILGALQTDRFGNINTVCIGNHARPRLRGPGTVGISALCGLSRRFYIMMTRHDRGAFVPKVDFVCGAGFLDGGTSRTDRGLPEGGPKPVVTPLGVFDFEPASKAMRIKSLHEGVTLEEARDNTGFDLLVPETLERTAPPTDDELFLLRRLVDTTGVLARKFPWPKAEKIR